MKIKWERCLAFKTNPITGTGTIIGITMTTDNSERIIIADDKTNKLMSCNLNEVEVIPE